MLFFGTQCTTELNDLYHVRDMYCRKVCKDFSCFEFFFLDLFLQHFCPDRER